MNDTPQQPHVVYYGWCYRPPSNFKAYWFSPSNPFEVHLPLDWRTTEVSPSLLPTGPDGSPSLTALIAGHEDVSSWVRGGHGFVGAGRYIVIRTTGGPDRVQKLRNAWRHVIKDSSWQDPLRRPGTGPVAIGAITFSPTSYTYSILEIPRVIVGLDAQGAWVTTVRGDPRKHPDPVDVLADIRRFVARPASFRAPRTLSVLPASEQNWRVLPEDEWVRRVAAAQERMRAGEAQKVVMARAALVDVRPRPHVGEVIHALAQRNPTAWTYGIQAMVGASPEMLLDLEDGRVFSRVLAGTARRHVDPATDPRQAAEEVARLSAWLRSSDKNVREHDLARASAVQALEPLCRGVQASDPFVLVLPRVLHLATDVTAHVAGDTGALALVDALHPTAAVCGTPRQAAGRIIEELEGLSRTFYAGPVGWVDWHGEGQWCIAIRGAQIPPIPVHSIGVTGVGPVTVYGGSGIMPDSDPDDELAETRAKMRTVMDALESAS